MYMVQRMFSCQKEIPQYQINYQSFKEIHATILTYITIHDEGTTELVLLR